MSIVVPMNGHHAILIRNFRRIQGNNNNRKKLEITKHQVYIYNFRTKIPTNDLDIPTRTKSKNTIVSKGDQFVEFTHTDMFKDAGQTTIPFIDSQDVVTTVPTPLVGAGVYYKSTPGYGGFIGLKIVTYDFTHHL